MKQHVVRAILRDIFQKTSHGIYFSSLGILKTSDEILKMSDEIGGKCPKFEMNEPKKTKRKRKKCVLIFQNEEKTCDFCRSALTFRLRDLALFNPNLLLERCNAVCYGKNNFLSSFILLLASCFSFVLTIVRYAFALMVNHLLNTLMKSVQNLMTDWG